MSELIPKFLEGIPKELSDLSTTDFETLRTKVLRSLFESLKLNEDNEKINNISSIILDISENKHLLEQILNDKEILSNLAKELANKESLKNKDNLDQNYNYYEILLVFINLIKTSITENFKLPSIKVESGEDTVNINLDEKNIDNTPLGEVILENLGKILDNFVFRNENEENSLNLEGTFGTTYKPLGLKK